jgi:ABC-2 type transport system permease protein
MRCILYLAQAEVLHIVRDRILLAQVLVVPVVQLLILSNAATFEIRNTPIHVVDLDRSSASRGVVNRLAASGHFEVVDSTPSVDRADERLLNGTATMVVVIPHDFEASLVRTGLGHVQLSVNAEKGSAAGIVQSYATRVLNQYAADLQAPRNVRAAQDPWGPASAGPRIDVRVRPLYNATQNYKHYMVPGILVALMTIIGTLLSAQNIAREKELGTLEQLNVTPLRRWELIVGKLLPYALVGLIDVCLVLSIAVLWFEVPLRGSVALLFALTALYLLSTLGLGLFVSTISSTQQQAMMTTTFFFLMPMIYLSGFIFPIENMPAAIQPITYLIPLRYFLVILRAIFLKGVGLDVLWPQVLALTAWGVAILSLAIARSTKRIA